MGYLPKRPLLRAMPFQDLHHAQSENEVAARQLIGINTLQNALNAMRREVVVISSAQRKRNVELYNRKTNVRSINLQVGEFVLVRKVRSSEHKLDFTWRGRRRVTECRSDSVYEVENLLSGRREMCILDVSCSIEQIWTVNLSTKISCELRSIAR